MCTMLYATQPHTYNRNYKPKPREPQENELQR